MIGTFPVLIREISWVAQRHPIQNHNVLEITLAKQNSDFLLFCQHLLHMSTLVIPSFMFCIQVLSNDVHKKQYIRMEQTSVLATFYFFSFKAVHCNQTSQSGLHKCNFAMDRIKSFSWTQLVRNKSTTFLNSVHGPLMWSFN